MPANWDYSGLSDSNLQTGTSYYITSKALDNAGNWQTDFVTGSETFWFDINVPTATLITPSNNVYLRPDRSQRSMERLKTRGTRWAGWQYLNLYIQRAVRWEILARFTIAAAWERIVERNAGNRACGVDRLLAELELHDL